MAYKSIYSAPLQRKASSHCQSLHRMSFRSDPGRQRRSVEGERWDLFSRGMPPVGGDRLISYEAKIVQLGDDLWK